MMNEEGSEEIEEKSVKGQKYDGGMYLTKKRKMGNDSKLERKDF